MPTYPDYVFQTLARAREEGQWYCGQADAAALCFDVLALFPDCNEASDLIYELFCDEWTIHDNRVAIQRQVEEWDDRPCEQRRRLALSFRFMSRWVGWEREYEDGFEQERDGPPDVAAILDEGKVELLGAYCLGDEECTDYAWTIFSHALEQTRDPRAALFWIGKIYADLGFFADAAEALAELCSRFADPDARRLLAEVIWWRDNAYRIPWLPPPGDGSRYDRMMQHIDPTAPTAEEQTRLVRSENQKERRERYRPSIAPQLANLFTASIPDEQARNPSGIVDWSFLDRDDGQPGEPADWVLRQARLLNDHAPGDMGADLDEILQDMLHRHRWTRQIQPPATPKRYDPNQLPFEPDTDLGDTDAI